MCDETRATIDAENVKIRPASHSDIKDLVELLSELFSIEADFTFDAERQRHGLEMMLADTETRCVLAAQAGNHVVGMCSVQIVISTAEGGPAGLVEDMVVRRQWRGRGIGRQLLRRAEAWAREKGIERLQLLADENNFPALAFYQERGWKRTQLICLRKK